MHYLDHNATAPMRASVLDAMVKSGETARNAMSLHHHGRKARVISDQARELLREHLGFPKAEVIYTSGGTEACLLYTSPSPRDRQKSRMPSSA